GEGGHLVYGRDAGVLELAGDPGLLDESRGRAGPGRKPLLEHLDGDLAVQGEVAGAIDHAHAAPADLLAELEAGRGRDRAGRRPTRMRGISRDGHRRAEVRVEVSRLVGHGVSPRSITGRGSLALLPQIIIQIDVRRNAPVENAPGVPPKYLTPG